MGKNEVVNSTVKNWPLQSSEVYRFSIIAVVLVSIGFLLALTGSVWLFLSAINEFIYASKLEAFKELGFSLILVYFGVFNLGYHLLLTRSNLIALVLQDDILYVCTVTGLQAIPKSKVRGCKSPVHRNNRSFG